MVLSAVGVFAFIAYLLILALVIADLFWRDPSTSGWAKALWLVFLIVVPYVTALIYLIVRGEHMRVRAHQAATALKRESQAHRRGAGRSPAQEISHAKELLDEGTITTAEFDTLKAKALD
jgi:Phospholipase_D-nuclease N-terminal